MSTGERILQAGKPAVGGFLHAWGHLAAEEPLDFGRAVQYGTDSETQCKLFTTGGKFIGISVYDATKGYETRDGSGNPSEVRRYLQYDNVVILRKGTVPVIAAETVEAGDSVYIDDTTGEFYAGSGAGKTLLAGATWVSDSVSVTGEGVIALIEIDLPA